MMKLLASSSWVAVAVGLTACSGGGLEQTSQMDSVPVSEPALLEANCRSPESVTNAIAFARADFNQAISNGEPAAIRSLLANDVILITGTNSDVYIGRDAQLAIWAEDFADDARLVYIRTPQCISMSGIFPIAIESGRWRGARDGDTHNYVSGQYSAKWREVDGQWMIEAETYMTTTCGGSLCPAM